MKTLSITSKAFAKSASLALGIAAIATAASSNRYLDNPDHVVDRSVETQFSPIGELESPEVREGNQRGTYRGTAFLVSPCYIMTAAHVVYGDDLVPEQGKDYSMVLRAGISTTAAFKGNTTAAPVISGDRDLAGRNDWALLKLTNCIGRRAEFGWFEGASAHGRALVGTTFAVAGYAGDRARGQLVIGIGAVKSFDPKTSMLMFAGSFMPGQSGGPALVFENGETKVAGVVSSEKGEVHGGTYDRYSDAKANEVQSIAEILVRADVKRILDRDKAVFGQSNPAAERMTRSLPTFAKLASAY